MFHILLDIREHFSASDNTKIIDEIFVKKGKKLLTKKGDNYKDLLSLICPIRLYLTFKQTTSAECWPQRTARG